MKHYNYIIVGAGIAGTNGAIAIRKEAPESSIVLIGEENYPVYSRVNISKIVSNAKQPKELLLKTEEQFQSQSIDRIIARVNNLNPTEKSIAIDLRHIKKTKEKIVDLIVQKETDNIVAIDEDDLVNTFEYILVKMPDWWKKNSFYPASICKNLNKILEQIKNGQNTKDALDNFISTL